VFIAATPPSKVTVELAEAPETKVVVPAVYETVPVLAVNVARTVSPFAQVPVFRNVVPRPRLRADAAVAARDFEKSRLLTVRDDIGSNSTMAPESEQVVPQSFHAPVGSCSMRSSAPLKSFGSFADHVLNRPR
jgi:hypothetical protein